jgi:p70 ribosomal S6 kinase
MQNFSEEQARFYMAEITSGLDYIHARNIVHRGIEPANILLDASGHVKISDFSSAVILDSDGSYADSQNSHYSNDSNDDGGKVKTCRYTAPEILMGSKHGKVADWFSMGTMLFEMLTGVVPFGMGNVLDTVAAVGCILSNFFFFFFFFFLVYCA